MTLISQIMKHPKQKQLIEMQAETERLFLRCKQSGQPFFEWPDWIKNHIETSLTMYKQFKQSRLARIFQRGKDLIQQKSESKKLSDSRKNPSESIKLLESSKSYLSKK